MTRTEQLAKFVYNTNYENLPSNVVKSGKNMILDTIGCMIGTTVEDPQKAETAWAIAKEIGGKEEATAIVAGFKLPAVWAAFVNGVLAHGIDFDDTHKEALTHTGAPIVPAALASTEAAGLGGKDLITAAVLGFEVSVRVGMTVMPTHYKYWHSTATNCTFGGAALSAKLFGCSEEQIINALGLAGTQAAGLLTYMEFGDFSKSFNPGKCSFNGVLSGVAAKVGASAPPTMLEHPRGYSFAYCSEEPKLDKLVDGLGVKYEILGNVPKPWPSLLASHPPIEAILALRKEYAIQAEDIAKITERTYNTVKSHFCNYNPQTTMAARLSVPYCIAVTAVKGAAGLPEFTMETINDPQVQEMLKKVEIIADPELNKLYPEKFPAVVTIETKDGKSFTKEIYYPLGDLKNPYSQEKLEDKFIKLTAPSLGEARAKEIINAINNLEQISNIQEFTKLLVK
ncbi:MAG TPA: MmgE/PrpD family protein [Desulfosporosinus sp.]|nr:MmgE/PrpD family protein [Desulfosporosinus sp.]